jgi:hypothetical protein
MPRNWGNRAVFGQNGPNFPETVAKWLKKTYEKRPKDEPEHTRRFAW